MSSIEIKKIGITKLNTDAIVNAANEGLWEGGGVCGAIFKEAGSAELTKACNAIGGCKTGNAVITAPVDQLGSIKSIVGGKLNDFSEANGAPDRHTHRR